MATNVRTGGGGGEGALYLFALRLTGDEERAASLVREALRRGSWSPSTPDGSGTLFRLCRRLARRGEPAAGLGPPW